VDSGGEVVGDSECGMRNSECEIEEDRGWLKHRPSPRPSAAVGRGGKEDGGSTSPHPDALPGPHLGLHPGAHAGRHPGPLPGGEGEADLPKNNSRRAEKSMDCCRKGPRDEQATAARGPLPRRTGQTCSLRSHFFTDGLEAHPTDGGRVRGCAQESVWACRPGRTLVAHCGRAGSPSYGRGAVGQRSQRVEEVVERRPMRR